MPVAAEPLDRLRRRTSVKWGAYPDDVLPLWVAEMDLPLAEPIAQALHDAIDRSDTGYLNGRGAVPEAFAGFAARRLGWEVSPAAVRLTIDVSYGLVEVLRRTIAPGDEVVVTPPVYPPFFEIVPEAGGRVAEVPLLTDGAGTPALDLDGIERAFRAGARAMLLCNPHNPLGHPHTREQLEALAVLAAAHGVSIVSDEIHAPLTHSSATFTPFLEVSDAARECGFSVTSASKAFNLAGLKCAVMVAASDRGIRAFDAMPEEVFWRASQFGAIATAAAFASGDEWLDGALQTIESNALLVERLVAERLPGVAYRRPHASYLAWLDFSGTAWAADPAGAALEQARVALNPGGGFGRQGAAFARLNFGTSPEIIEEAVGRMAEALASATARRAAAGTTPRASSVSRSASTPEE
ncbi:MalY/PatB family protein [Ruicaihuangia caeni]|uniref:MalY/PatB family protein n=1 Tax=Ruicaihuangia caeni TaxID=3042517 RepID=UPI0033902025